MPIAAIGALLIFGFLTAVTFWVGAAMMPRRALLRVCGGLLAVVALWWLIFDALKTARPMKNATFGEVSSELGERPSETKDE